MSNLNMMTAQASKIQATLPPHGLEIIHLTHVRQYANFVPAFFYFCFEECKAATI
jgi:hypothetical protein